MTPNWRSSFIGIGIGKFSAVGWLSRQFSGEGAFPYNRVLRKRCIRKPLKSIHEHAPPTHGSHLVLMAEDVRSIHVLKENP